MRFNFKTGVSRSAIRIFLLINCLLICFNGVLKSQHKVSRYNLVYNSPSASSWGSMVCGNGNISSNVWIDTSGNLQCYIGAADSRDSKGNLLKISEIEIRFFPSIFKDARVYRQEFDLQTAAFNVITSRGRLKFWVDANNPQILIQIDATQPVQARVVAHRLRRQREIIDSVPLMIYREPDIVLQNRKEDVVLLHRNGSNELFDTTMKLFGLNSDKIADPLKNLTWGILVSGNNFDNESDSVLGSRTPGKNIDLRITVHSGQPETVQEWISETEEISKRLRAKSQRALFKAHAGWWRDFWNRSYIDIEDNYNRHSDTLFLINRAYYYNRYVMGIAAKGKFPIQFNGSTWLVDTYPDTIHSIVGGSIFGKSADYRLWDNLILWQNMRTPYWTMLASGDTAFMHSLLDFYTDHVFPQMREITQNLFGFKGALFTESTTVWGVTDPYIYGWDRDGKAPEDFTNKWHQYHYVCGIELINLMLDYYSYTKDDDYLLKKIWPVSNDLIDYYSSRYSKDGNGKIEIFPARSLESFTDCTNPTPIVSGLRFVSSRLRELARESGDAAFEIKCDNLFRLLPPVPLKIQGSDTTILVAEKYGEHINVEQPDLYAVYPFRLYSIGTPHLQIGRYTFMNPSFSDTSQHVYGLMPTIKIKESNSTRPIFSWNQTGVQAAYLGLVDYAKEILTRSALSNDRRFRFPAFYGPNYDWIPDGDHLAIINMTLQSMVLQCEGDSLFFLPAWPKEWNVKFKLCATGNTTVWGQFKDGNLIKTKTKKSNRRRRG